MVDDLAGKIKQSFDAISMGVPEPLAVATKIVAKRLGRAEQDINYISEPKHWVAAVRLDEGSMATLRFDKGERFLQYIKGERLIPEIMYHYNILNDELYKSLKACAQSLGMGIKRLETPTLPYS